MILAPSLESLYNKHKEELLKIHYKEQLKLHDYKLEPCYTDSNGVSYSRFKDGKIPLERLGKMQDYIDMMGSGISKEELSELIASADNELALAYAGKKAKMSHVGWVLSEIQDRMHLIIHTELLYHFVAVQTIREDEPPFEYVEKIHLEKIEQFKQDNKDGSTFFFFQVPQLKMVNDRLKFTEADWNASWKESEREQRELKRKIDLLAGGLVSTKGTKTPAST